MPSKSAQRLRDIVTTSTRSRPSRRNSTTRFTWTGRAVYAVVRALEIVSEASRRLPDELTDRHPEIDWAAMLRPATSTDMNTKL